MSNYFNISHGLRGCYMPDSDPYVIRADTRRELKKAVEYEARVLRDSGYFGCSKRNAASLAAEGWRCRNDRRWTLDLVLGCSLRRGASEYGLFLARATRQDFLAQESEC
jgi:hypothetical protein